MKQYKVLSAKDKWYTGKFDPERLEEAINSYAKQGWVVKVAFTSEIPAPLGTRREEVLIVLERDI